MYLRYGQIHRCRPTYSWHTQSLSQRCITDEGSFVIFNTGGAGAIFLLSIGKNTCAECVWSCAGCLKVETECRCVYYLEPTEKSLCLNYPKRGDSAIKTICCTRYKYENVTVHNIEIYHRFQIK